MTTKTFTRLQTLLFLLVISGFYLLSILNPDPIWWVISFISYLVADEIIKQNYKLYKKELLTNVVF